MARTAGNFDGVALLVRPSSVFNGEAYGGRSLAKALNEPLTSDELRAVEPFAPDVGAYIIGGRVSVRPSRRGAITAMYEREIRTDRLGLYAERAAVDGMLRLGAASVDGELRYDFATAKVNEARLRAWLPPFGPITVNVYARHHDPFFELWTIWGAFSPFSFREAGVSGSWRKVTSPIEVAVWGSGRQYRGPDAANLFGEVRSDGFRFGTSLSARLDDDWTLSGQYRAEVGFGAARSDGTARVQRSFGTGEHVAINLAAFQRLYELRVEEGTVLGYRIQLFASPTLAETRAVRSMFQETFPGWETEIVLEAPDFKLQVGAYSDRFEAHRAWQVLIPEYPGAFLVRSLLPVHRL